MLGLLMSVRAADRDIRACKRYFYHLIMARQLSDDACDWREDLKADKSTLIVCWMRKDCSSQKSPSEIEALFRDRIKPRAAKEILRCARASIAAAREICCLADTEFLEELPRYYKDMAMRILARRPTHI
jgi:geranylgeranyl pyrophosphate synthase